MQARIVQDAYAPTSIIKTESNCRSGVDSYQFWVFSFQHADFNFRVLKPLQSDDDEIAFCL